MPLLLPGHDPMGTAIRAFHTTGRADKLIVSSSMFDDDELPVPTLFRTPAQMNGLERRALQLAQNGGRVLDVGAGAGCHALALQQAGADVTAIDISPLAVETMRERGVARARAADFFDPSHAECIGGGYGTVLMLMNGLGIAGRLDRLPRLFGRLDEVLAAGGCALADSSDLRYVFEEEDGSFCPESGRYYGEVDFRMTYGGVRGRRFNWLYVDFDTLAKAAAKAGFVASRVMRGEHYDYLCKLERAGA